MSWFEDVWTTDRGRGDRRSHALNARFGRRTHREGGLGWHAADAPQHHGQNSLLSGAYGVSCRARANRATPYS